MSHGTNIVLGPKKTTGKKALLKVVKCHTVRCGDCALYSSGGLYSHRTKLVETILLLVVTVASWTCIFCRNFLHAGFAEPASLLVNFRGCLARGGYKGPASGLLRICEQRERAQTGTRIL